MPRQDSPPTLSFDPVELALLNDFQQGLPLSSTPYAEMASQLGISEERVLELLQRLQGSGAISRVGPVFRTHSIGASTLAAMRVPEAQLEEVANIINRFEEVNHNYEREHTLNLWFVVTAPNQQHLERVLAMIARQTGFSVIALPMLEDYHINLGFELQWT
ncbi:MAG TPA: Lrp/AsnC family transcriptional regulator [Gammaproteobacteria bacterium]